MLIQIFIFIKFKYVVNNNSLFVNMMLVSVKKAWKNHVIF